MWLLLLLLWGLSVVSHHFPDQATPTDPLAWPSAIALGLKAWVTTPSRRHPPLIQRLSLEHRPLGWATPSSWGLHKNTEEARFHTACLLCPSWQVLLLCCHYCLLVCNLRFYRRPGERSSLSDWEPLDSWTLLPIQLLWNKADCSLWVNLLYPPFSTGGLSERSLYLVFYSLNPTPHIDLLANQHFPRCLCDQSPTMVNSKQLHPEW